MRAITARTYRALLTLLVAGSVGRASPPEEPRQPSILLQGSVNVEEKSGEDRSHRSFRATLLLLSGERDGRWIALRLLEPALEGEEPLAAMDVLEGRLGAGEPALQPAEETPMELEESSGALEGLLPLAVLKPAAVPAAAEERKEVETVVLGLASVRLPLAVRAQTSDGRRRIEVRLADGARPEFKYNDGKGWVTSFVGVHALGPSGSPESIEETASVEIVEEESRTGAERRSALKATDSGASRGDAAGLAREIEEIAKLFASRRPSKDIAPRIEKLAAAKGRRLEEIASKALSARLSAYRALFEKDDDGRKLAALLGGPAPDFTLEALDGKKVSFRELGRGKAVLLSFWGVG